MNPSTRYQHKGCTRTPRHGPTKTYYHAEQDQETYIDLLFVVTLLGAPPPAGLATLGGSLLAAAPLGLPAALRRLPLRS